MLGFSNQPGPELGVTEEDLAVLEALKAGGQSPAAALVQLLLGGTLSLRGRGPMGPGSGGLGFSQGATLSAPFSPGGGGTGGVGGR